MKNPLSNTGSVAVTAAGVIVVAGVALAFARADAPAASPTTAPATRPAAGEDANEVGVIQVDDLVANPAAHAGRIRLRGIVAGVNKAEGVVALIDAREFEACGTLNCAENLIPVRVAGDLPEPKSLVLATGEVAKGERGMEFKAESVEIIPN